MVKHLEECDSWLRKIVALSKKIVEDEKLSTNVMNESKPKTSLNSSEKSLYKCVKELKKSMCSIGELLSINLKCGVEKQTTNPVDLDNEEILESCIKKVNEILF